MKKFLIVTFFISLSWMFTGCRYNNVNVDNGIEKFFKENNISGTFALLDNGHTTFDIYNLERYKDSAYSPGATFDIINALIALETGRLKDENSIIKYNHDSSSASLKNVFEKNNDTAFASIAYSVGKDTLQFWLDSLKYGNTKIKSADEYFWLNDSLKITPDVQLGFIDKFYFSLFPFQKRVQKIVQNLMLKENNTMYSLSYKTSVHYDSKGRKIGWLLGWIEENRHVYFFVINAQGDSMTEAALVKTLKEILVYKEFMKGDK
ncbi:MAG: penicillin-binding transpeptidase domain-containing protein [Arachidicoccus sp.]|nr:penicillin-binding transpeptidase domain-containing protein [Arachidicoccus sp.]